MSIFFALMSLVVIIGVCGYFIERSKDHYDDRY